jgi:polygalacturonase
MPKISIPTFPDNDYDIRNYGAQENQTFLNTLAFKKAISDCSKKGGGKIIVPPGTWLTGPIHLTDNINLEIQKNAKLVLSTNIDNYLPPVFTRFEGVEFYGFSPLIYTQNSQNIAITGKGEINGSGKFWEDILKAPRDKNDFTPSISSNDRSTYGMAQDDIPVEKRVFVDKKKPIQPSFIQFVNCKNILIEDIQVIDGPNWTIHPIYSENITIKNIFVKTDKKTPME